MNAMYLDPFPEDASRRPSPANADFGFRHPAPELKAAIPGKERPVLTLPGVTASKAAQETMELTSGFSNRAKPEGDGIADFIRAQRSEAQSSRELETGYGFTSCSLKQNIAVGESEREWLVPGLIPRGELVIWAGPPGSGKSTLLTQLLVSGATGHPFLGLPVEVGSVVGLFHEDTRRTLASRLQRLFSEWSIDVDDLDASGRLMYEARDHDPESEIRRKIWDVIKPTEYFAELERKLEYVGDVTMIAIDTLTESMFGDPTTSNPARHFLSALMGLCDRKKITIIGSTHLKRNANETAGSSEIDRKGRHIIHLIRGRNNREGTLKVVKSNCGPEISIAYRQNSNMVFELRPDSPQDATRTQAPTVLRSAHQTLRDVFLNEVRERPGGVSRRKTAPKYGPRLLQEKWGKRLKVAEAEFAAVMEALLEEGLLGEESLDRSHPGTKTLCILERPT